MRKSLKNSLLLPALLGICLQGCAGEAGPVVEKKSQCYGREALTIENGLVRLSVVPALGGRVVELVNLATGHDYVRIADWFMKYNPDDNWLGAEYGGFCDVGSEGWPGPFWGQAYDCKTREYPDGARSIVAVACAEDVRVEREMVLYPDSTRLSVRMKATNVAKAEKNLMIRFHCELRVGSRADDNDWIILAGTNAPVKYNYIMGAEDRRHRTDTTVGWGGIVDCVEKEGLVRRFMPEDQPSTIFFWNGFNEGDPDKAERDENGGFYCLDRFGRKVETPSGGSIEAAEEWFLVRGLSGLSTVKGDVAIELTTDRCRYGSRDTVGVILRAASSGKQGGIKGKVALVGGKDGTAGVEIQTGPVSAGGAAEGRGEIPLKDVSDGTYQLKAELSDGSGASLGKATAEFTVVGELVARARASRDQATSQVKDAHNRAKGRESALDVRTMLQILDNYQANIEKAMAEARYEEAMSKADKLGSVHQNLLEALDRETKGKRK